MNESVLFPFVPGQLILVGNRQYGFRWRYFRPAGGKKQQHANNIQRK
jgi:hypothetical protein